MTPRSPSPRAIPLHRPTGAAGPYAGDADDDSVQSAVEEVVAAGQQFVVDRLDLWQLELKDQAMRAAEGATLFGIAGLFGLFALVTLSGALGLGLAQLMPGWAAALATGGVHLLIAGGAAGIAVARRRQAVIRDAGPQEAMEG